MKDPGDLPAFDDVPDPFEGAGSAQLPALDARHLPPSPARARVRSLRWAALALALGVQAVGYAVVGHRTDLGEAARWRLAAGVLVPLAAAGLGLVAAAGVGELGVGQRASRLAVLVGLVPVMFAGGVALVSPVADDDPLFWPRALRCVMVTVALTLPALALAAIAFRRAFVAAAGWRTSALGAACGALSAATMSLVCPDVSALHVLLGHGLMILAGAALGAALARPLTRV
jgi:hypothetical protein